MTFLFAGLYFAIKAFNLKAKGWLLYGFVGAMAASVINFFLLMAIIIVLSPLGLADEIYFLISLITMLASIYILEKHIGILPNKNQIENPDDLTEEELAEARANQLVQEASKITVAD